MNAEIFLTSLFMVVAFAAGQFALLYYLERKCDKAEIQKSEPTNENQELQKPQQSESTWRDSIHDRGEEWKPLVKEVEIEGGEFDGEIHQWELRLLVGQTSRKLANGKVFIVDRIIEDKAILKELK